MIIHTIDEHIENDSCGDLTIPEAFATAVVVDLLASAAHADLSRHTTLNPNPQNPKTPKPPDPKSLNPDSYHLFESVRHPPMP